MSTHKNIDATDTELTEAAREARAAYQREWRKRNPEKVRATQQRYWAKKARILQAEEEGVGK